MTVSEREFPAPVASIRDLSDGIESLLSTIGPTLLSAREGHQFPAFDLRDVQLRYAAATAPVISGVTASFLSGDFVSIVGPSGCGKSTFLRMLAGLLVPTSGAIVRGFDSDAGRIGFVFQHPTLLPWRTAIENLQLPLELGLRPSQRRLTYDESLGLLNQVGLKQSDVGKRPSELSGGMQMRLSLARALATRPEVLLLDEPFAAVDDLLRMKLQDDVRRIHEDRRLTTILVTHNLHEAIYLSDRVLVMSSAPSCVSGDLRVVPSGESRRSPEFRESEVFQAAVQKVSRLLFAPIGPRTNNRQHQTEPAE
ncbi:MAG: ABC transporter ATP-binding protein [Planctomycetota bacterium]